MFFFYIFIINIWPKPKGPWKKLAKSAERKMSGVFIFFIKTKHISFPYNNVKVNQKWPFSGLGVETWEIKCYLWVRNQDFQTNFLFPVFNSKLQVWFSFRNLNLILVVLAYWSLYLLVSNCKLLRRTQI